MNKRDKISDNDWLRKVLKLIIKDAISQNSLVDIFKEDNEVHVFCGLYERIFLKNIEPREIEVILIINRYSLICLEEKLKKTIRCNY